MPSVQRPLTVRVEREGRVVSSRQLSSPTEVVRAVRELLGQRDVTLSVEPDGLGERVLVAVDGARCFLGLERSDGIFQFCPADPAAESHQFQVGGQPTDIEARYVVDHGAAPGVIEEWLARGEASSAGFWERQ